MPLPLVIIIALGALGLPGCVSHPGQEEAIQGLARDLGDGHRRSACSRLVKVRWTEVPCDEVLEPLLHYARGFAGSTVTRRGRTAGWPWSATLQVPAHYQGPAGSGDLDVQVRREEGEWRIVSIQPVSR